MSQKKTSDIDALLQNTWLQVISLRHGPVFGDGEGRKLWERCVADAERVQQSLKEAGYGAETCRHILYAQCALTDEVVKGRGVQDDACVQWYDVPLQGHFLGTLEAGDALCNRMRDVLREPAPEPVVITCFHRVMMLGFLGGYRSLNDPEREKLVQALGAQVPPFSLPQARPILAGVKNSGRLSGWLSTWPVRIGLSVLVLVALWWGLNHWLDRLLTTLLPGVMR